MKEIGLMMTDTHLSSKTLKINESIWQQAIDLCLERGIKKIFHLGDVLDSRKSQSQEILTALHATFINIAACGLELHVIPGNHDKTNYNSFTSFLDPFKFHKGVHLYSDITTLQFGNLQVFFCPFFDEKSGRYQEILSEYLSDSIEMAETNILLTHVGIDGSVMNSGIMIENHASVKLFDVFDKVYVGHFHDYNELNGGQIVYIGSAFQSNFGEDDNKGFSILKEDGSIEFVQSNFPKYNTINVDLDNLPEDKLNDLMKTYSNSEDNIKFKITGDKSKLVNVNKSEFNNVGISISISEKDAEVLDYDSMQVVSFDQSNILEEWKEFISSFSQDESVKKLGLKYMNYE